MEKTGLEIRSLLIETQTKNIQSSATLNIERKELNPHDLELIDNFSQENDIKKIDLLKIDAEGSEMSILEGAKEILQKGVIKLVFVEITDTKSNFKLKKLQIKNFLGKYEFYLASSKKIKSVSFLSNLYAEDCLFILSQ